MSKYLSIRDLMPENGKTFLIRFQKRRKRPTNADRIRSMTDEELAMFIKDIIVREFHYHGLIGKFESAGYWLDWLKQEVVK